MTIPESEMERAKSERNSPAGMPALPDAEDEPIEPVGYDFGLSRRGFVQILSAGLLIAGSVSPALAQGSGRRGSFCASGSRNLSAPMPFRKHGAIPLSPW